MFSETQNQNTEQTKNYGLFRILQFLCLWIVLGLTTNAQPAKASEDRTKLELGNRVLLENSTDGFMSISQIGHSPDGKHFAVIGCGYECNDNIGFLFNADGSGKRKFTARWDNILQDKIEWSADSKKLFYYRINSTGADSPKNAPAAGWVEVDVGTGQKRSAVSRRLRPESTYGVFRVEPGDFLNIRETPLQKSKIVAKLPHDAKSVKVTTGRKTVGKYIWVKITHNGATGWVNQNFLYEIPKDQ